MELNLNKYLYKNQIKKEHAGLINNFKLFNLKLVVVVVMWAVAHNINCVCNLWFYI